MRLRRWRRSMQNNSCKNTIIKDKLKKEEGTNMLIKDENDWDCRAIPERFLKRFCSPTIGLSMIPFVKLVIDHNELELVLRGNHYGKNPNAGGEVVIYRNNHAMFTIRANTVTFNPNYLRYDPDWEDAIGQLVETYKYNEGIIPKLGPVIRTENPKTHVVSYSCSFEKDSLSVPITQDLISRLPDLYVLLTTIFDTFFSTEEKYYQDQFLLWGNMNDPVYKGNVEFKKKKIELEKIRQQQLFTQMKSQKNGYFFYDMEFEQKHKTKVDAEKDRKNGLNNKPDMQAIRYNEEGKPEAWVFVEVKCTESAYDGTSSLKDHIEKMRKYIANTDNLIRRRREAYLMLHQYEQIGLIKLERNIEPSEYENLPAEIILIFTDDAIDKWKNDKDNAIVALRKKQENELGQTIKLNDDSEAIIVKDY